MSAIATQTHPDILSDAEAKHLKQQYETPPELFEWVNDVVKQFGIYGFGIDLAADANNKKCKYFICAPGDTESAKHDDCILRDALNNQWPCADPFSVGWFNCPFGLSDAFIKKAHEQARCERFSVGLTQTGTSERWWQFAKKVATARIDIAPRVNFIHHPRLLAHLKALGKTPSSNPGGNTIWIFNPHDIDRPGGHRVVDARPWRQ